MKKVLILQNSIPHYRIPFYNQLSKYYDLTVVHSHFIREPLSREKKVSGETNFSIVRLSVKKIGPFLVQKKLFSTISTLSPDIIIIMFDLRWIKPFFLLLFIKSKIVFWGLDKGKNKLVHRVKLLVSKLGYPIIFYHKLVKDQFIKDGLNKNICFVANNTFHVENRLRSFKYTKKHLLFVGTLNSRKMLDVCIDAFIKINELAKNKYKFIIIGDGEERDNLIDYINKRNQSNNIYLIGALNNTNDLEKYYKNAFASISYGQAGLSVLQSFAYGVPFITKRNSISGGENNNIINEFNGLLVDEKVINLEKALKRIMFDEQFSKILGKNAFDYYSKNCTLDQMVNRFKLAIESYKL